MTRVAKENQGLEATFVDLENLSDEEITAKFRDNTRVHTFILISSAPSH